MKNALLAALVTVGVVLAVPASSYAAADLTLVTGTVRAGSSKVTGADVTVNCNSVSRSTSTDGSGNYSVVFNAVECPDGATASTTATKGGASGNNIGPVEDKTIVNVALVDVNVALPEMGTVVGGVAALGGAGAFMIMRKRQQHQFEKN